MKIMLKDGSLKYYPLFSIFDSTMVLGGVFFEKKSMMSRAWKSAECTLNL